VITFLIQTRRYKTAKVTGGVQLNKSVSFERSLELYANPFSHCSRKVRLALEEKGIDYRYRKIDLIETGSYETLSPNYLKINPSGLVPTLVHDGRPIYESDEILVYIDNLTKSPALIPENPEQQSEVSKWLEFCAIPSSDPMGFLEKNAGACVPGLTMPLFMTMMEDIPINRLARGIFYHPDKKRPLFFTASKLRGISKMLQVKPLQGMILRSRDAMSEHLAMINGHLERSEGMWILGETFTLVDITLGVIYKRLEESQWFDYFSKHQDLRHVISHFENLKQRPSWMSLDFDYEPVDRGVSLLKEHTATNKSVRDLLYSTT
tara:strand:- start:422 stop:1384 length:963 start_codon:yes stop_codon:yes gene_type:complete